MKKIVLAIDQGTTGTTCLAVDFQADGRRTILGKGYAPLPQHFPQAGWVEHDLQEIWQSVCTAAHLALQGIDRHALAAVALTNQRETAGIWDRHGKPLARAIVWQDRRTAPLCRQLLEQGHGGLVLHRTGLRIDPYFSATKWAWLLAEDDQLAKLHQRDELCLGTIDSWLLWQLTSGQTFATDVTNASRTMLLNSQTLGWDGQLCDLLGIRQACLPQLVGNTQLAGVCKGVPFLPDGLPIAGMAGDQQAALFGQACFKPGMAKCTYGTGAFALVNTGPTRLLSQRGLLSTIAWHHKGETTYALEGSVFVAGAVVQWLRDGLHIIEHSHDIESLAASVPHTDGVVFVPALTGLGAPHWQPEVRGAVFGLTRGTSKGHLARAALEGIALQIYDLFESMRLDSGAPLHVLRVDGGAAENQLLLRFQCDILGIPIHRAAHLESTGLGAAALGALAVGLVQSMDELAQHWSMAAELQPQADIAWVQDKLQQWRNAMGRLGSN